jgi:hypothetical protein
LVLLEVKMRAVALVERNFGLAAIVLAVAAVLSAGVAIKASGIRPYGEQAIQERIDDEDGILCEKFGFAVTTPQSADCMLALAELRQRHVELLVSYSWL